MNRPWLHNLQSPVQNESEGPPIQKLRIAKEFQQMQALLSTGPMHLNKVHFHRAGCVGEVCVHTGVGAEFRWWQDCVHPNLPWVLSPCFFPCCSSNPSTTVISWDDILLLLFLSWQWDPELCAFLPRILSLSYPSLPQNNLELLFCHGYCWGDITI